MKNYFRAVLCLKSRYGEADAVDCCYFNGKTNVWEELPKANEIYDYSKYVPIEPTDIQKEDKTNKKMNFTI